MSSVIATKMLNLRFIVSSKRNPKNGLQKSAVIYFAIYQTILFPRHNQ
jgi:hypothetical protein